MPASLSAQTGVADEEGSETAAAFLKEASAAVSSAIRSSMEVQSSSVFFLKSFTSVSETEPSGDLSAAD